MPRTGDDTAVDAADDGGEPRKKQPLPERMFGFVTKSASERPDPKWAGDDPVTVEELQEAVRHANDKERLLGVIAAPVAGMVALFTTVAIILSNKDLKGGSSNPAYVVPSHVLTFGTIALALAAATLAFAWFRKRAFLGVVLVLFGMTIFNLKFWGFGLPFVILGFWYLLHSYQLSKKLKTATAEAAAGRTPTRSASADRVRASKRYTPKTKSRRTN